MASTMTGKVANASHAVADAAKNAGHKITEGAANAGRISAAFPEVKIPRNSAIILVLGVLAYNKSC